MRQRIFRDGIAPTGTVLFAATLVVFATSSLGCSDTPPLANDGGDEHGCSTEEVWDPVQETCVPGQSESNDGGGANGGGGANSGGPNNGGGANGGGGTNSGGPNNGTTGGNDNDGPGEPTCSGLECDQIACPPGEDPTTLTGTVTIPSGELPLPNVTVYVPNAALDDIPDVVSCERCEDMLSGNPLVQTTTDMNGNFQLQNVPVASDVPLVMQTGKWRRKVHISNIEECTRNEVTDPDKTRLPRNQTEGNIPRIAVTTGGWDTLECLVHKIGLDDREFTTEHDDSGQVSLFTGHSAGYGASPTSEFAPSFNNGEMFTAATSWWNDFSNLEKYDIIMHSCSDPHASPQAREALQQFADVGGRVFMTDLHREWLEEGTSDFQSVANWQEPIPYPGTDMEARIDLDPPGSGMMLDWMDARGHLDFNDNFSVTSIQKNIGSVNTNLAERWIYSAFSSAGERDLYFAFNTPVGAPDDNQCGRVVYSDLHVAAGDGATPGLPFPDSCSDGPMSAQEQALVYMFFDLAACIDPDCIPLSCSEVPGNCDVHDNGCGGSIDCGECCVDIGESCTHDEDCCDSLWCDNGTCSDSCRPSGDFCMQHNECCSETCDTELNECIEG